jgi:hypothetical protein
MIPKENPGGWLWPRQAGKSRNSVLNVISLSLSPCS